MRRQRLRGKNCRTVICIGHPCSRDNPGVGHLNGYAFAATPRWMSSIVAATHADSARLPHPRPLPACIGFARVQPRLGSARSSSPRWPTRPAPRTSCRCGRPCFARAHNISWPRCRAGPRSLVLPSPPGTLASGRAHSWLLVPLLHAAAGRLHSDALAAWQAHAHYAPLWQRALDVLRRSPPVQPAALVHALHTLQHLATEEGRAPPLFEAQLLLTIVAK